MELHKLTAVQAKEALDGGRMSCAEYARALIERCHQAAGLNALITFDEEAFLRRMAQPALGPLHGLPLIIKDNINAAGFPTTGNTPTLVDYRPEQSNPVVQALVDAGAVVMAKANLHELAMGPGIGRPPPGEEMRYGQFGPVLNPHNTNVTAGGSSSGTGAAIAAGLAPLGLGTDTGGSVKKPASFCGITGFRPSTGLYSQNGVIPISPSRDTIGPMARSAADLALMHSCITGQVSAPRTSGIKGLRLGLLRDFYFSGMDAQVSAVMEAELTRLAGLGAELIELDIAGLDGLMDRPRRAIAMYESEASLMRFLAQTGTGVGLEELIDGTRTTGLRDYLLSATGGGNISEEDYRAAVDQDCPAIRTALAALFNTHRLDALAAPSSLVPPKDREEDFTIQRKGETLRRFAAEGHNSGLSSIAGLPTISLPAGQTNDGLPIGISFDGPAGGDQSLLAIAQTYEASRPAQPGPPDI